MSLLNLVEDNIKETEKKYSDLIGNFNNDVRAGAAFMLYALETMFKNLEFDDIEQGIVDSSYRGTNHDYGIDAIYLTANDDIITSEEDLDDFNQDTKFVFHILQFKKGKGVGQDDLLKLKEGIIETFINNNVVFEKNSYMFFRVGFFQSLRKRIYQKFSSDQIKIKIYVVFGGLKSTFENDSLLVKQRNDIKSILVENAYQYNDFEVIDSEKLIEASKNNYDIVDIIKCIDSFEYVSESEANQKLVGYIGITRGSEISNLVKKWQTALFEANIRDYYRRNDLNNKIIETCTSDEAKYFWSYNNGLTITCRRVEKLPNKEFRLHGIQIVNGCQTSNALYSAAKNIEKVKEMDERTKNGSELSKKEIKEYEKISSRLLNEKTTVLTKIIETNDPDLIYKITETTNSQTPIKTFSLKANDNIQQHIEVYLNKYDIYYERRINFYKNQNKRNIISIQKLFQLQMAQFNFKPSQVRARPKALFNQHYESVFGGQGKFNAYRISIMIDFALTKAIRNYLKASNTANSFEAGLLAYGRLHMGIFLMHAIIGKYNRGLVEISTEKIISSLQDEIKLNSNFIKALENFKNIVKTISGDKVENLPAILTKLELDEKIAKFVNSKKK